MATTWVREFTGGLDTRKLPETSPGGTLIRARDVHITRGGEVEQRADFVPVYTLPAGETKGLASTPGGLVVFGHQASVAVPSGLTFQRLQSPAGEALARIRYATLYNGDLQVAAEFSDGSAYLFYDGSRVSDANAPPNVDPALLPNALLTHDQKMYVGAGGTLFFSGVGDSMDFGAGTAAGEGFEVMATHSEKMDVITALARYDDLVAVFARRAVLLWFFDPDPTLNRRVQELDNTGAIATRAVTKFGDGDLFYLDVSGVRSVRARDSSNSAATTDVGSAIDTEITAFLDTLTAEQASRAVGVIEPRDGRYWLAIHDRIYVFSYFTATRVSAWTEYRPGFVVDDMVVYNDRVWVRSGDIVYVYGGTGVQYAYSNGVGEVWLPYLDGDDPTRAKHMSGVDVACRGTWRIKASADPENEQIEDLIANVVNSTFREGMIGHEMEFNHISLRMSVLQPPSSSTPARLGAAVIHFDSDGEEDSG